MSRFRFLFIVFFLTACAVFTVHLRTSAVRLFNQYCTAMVAQKQLSVQLWQKQLHFESLINPAGLIAPLPSGNMPAGETKPSP